MVAGRAIVLPTMHEQGEIGDQKPDRSAGLTTCSIDDINLLAE
jgi:hypothetical protein